MKKQRSNKATVSTPVQELTREESIEHYNAIMIEELTRKIDIVIEGLESFRKELRREIDSFRTEANARFDIVEAAIRVNAQGIRDLQARMDRMESHHEHQTARITKLEGIA